MAAPATLDALLCATPGVQGGQLCLAGGGVRATTVIIHYLQGRTAEEIAHDFTVDLAGVHAALAYYYANKVAVDQWFEDDAAEYDRLAAENERELDRWWKAHHPAIAPE